MNKTLVTTGIVTFLIAVIAVCGGLFFLFWPLISPTVYSLLNRNSSLPSQTVATSTSYDGAQNLTSALLASDQYLIQSNKLFGQKNYAGAAALLETDLTQPSKNDADRGVLMFRIAQIYAYAGDYDKSVIYYKDIAAVTSYAPIVRATAIQDMAHLYRQYADPTITTAIFKDASYASFAKNVGTAAAYRNIYAYSASFYPLALSEFFVADWYASAIESSSTPDQALVTKYTATVGKRLSAGKPNLNELAQEYATASSSVLQYEYLNALEERAVVLGHMELAGNTTFGDTESSFKELLAEYSNHPELTSDWTARFDYALFLAQKYGTARAADITDVLAPVCQDPDAHGHIRIHIANTKHTSANMLLLASLDPDFKTLLLQNGWNASDFMKK